MATQCTSPPTLSSAPAPLAGQAPTAASWYVPHTTAPNMPPCSNHRSLQIPCIHGDFAAGVCLCRPGWSGADCSTPVYTVRRCINGVWSAAASTCVCNTGWTGTKCDIALPTSFLTSTDCFMGTLQASTCACDALWTDRACNTSLCRYGDVAYGPSGGAAPTCACKGDWVGPGCAFHKRGACSFQGTVTGATMVRKRQQETLSLCSPLVSSATTGEPRLCL